MISRVALSSSVIVYLGADLRHGCAGQRVDPASCGLLHDGVSLPHPFITSAQDDQAIR